MALTTCPECSKQISSTAISCPNCGYSFTNAQKVINQVRSTEISRAKKNPAAGISLIILGVIFVIVSMFFLPIGFAATLVGAAFVSLGITSIKGALKANCPYCGKENRISEKSDNMKCTVCKKISVRDGKTMKTVND